MEHIEYFKLQAKNLLKDYKTRFFNEKEEVYDYHAKYFDINGIFCDFGISDCKDDFSFTLMNAQHVIAQLAGFENWDELVKESPASLELSHCLFDNSNYKIKNKDKGYTSTNIYYELDEQEKLIAIKVHQEKGFSFMPEDKVECLHCGDRYQFKNVKALRVKPQYRTTKDFDEIVCKNYPRCNGSIIDFIRVEERESWKSKLQ